MRCRVGRSPIDAVEIVGVGGKGGPAAARLNPVLTSLRVIVSSTENSAHPPTVRLYWRNEALALSPYDRGLARRRSQLGARTRTANRSDPHNTRETKAIGYGRLSVDGPPRRLRLGSRHHERVGQQLKEMQAGPLERTAAGHHDAAIRSYRRSSIESCCLDGFILDRSQATLSSLRAPA